MGTITTTIEVGDPRGRNFHRVKVEVDTGSTYTALPRAILQALDVPVGTEPCHHGWPTAPCKL